MGTSPFELWHFMRDAKEIEKTKPEDPIVLPRRSERIAEKLDKK
jgi:hypothetical protein